MSWAQNPFVWMALVNVITGFFSGVAGLKKAIMDKAPIPDFSKLDTSNPWQYVLGGSITALIGVGNWFQFNLATFGTLFFIYTSICDGWFGTGSKDWRFYTLTAYILVQSALVIWSTQIQSLFTLP